MSAFALSRKHKKQDKPRITAWPLIAIFAGLVILAICVGMIPANPLGSLVHQYFLPEVAALLGFYLVGRTRSVIVIALCLFLLPTAQAMLIFGPAGCLDWVHETLGIITGVYRI